MHTRQTPSRAGRRGATALLSASILLASCSAPPEEDEGKSRAIVDPPGAAAALSIGGSLEDDGSGPYEGAVNCATALTITARTLAPMTTGANSREMRLIRRATDIYRDRAIEASEEGASRRVVLGDIARAVREKSADAGGQAQLSIACLRGLEEQL